MKKLFVFLGLAGLSVSVIAGCKPVQPSSVESSSTVATSSISTSTPTEVRGVTATSIKVGNTAATSGGYAVVGVPFNDLIKAVFKKVNSEGGVDGRTIDFVTYDDTFDAAKGKTFTEKLINDDKVFAIVGHFGTGTVGATLDILRDNNVPMVYAATGINALYVEKAVGDVIMAVQPIYKTDGRVMTARAINEKVYGVNEDEALPVAGKIGVLYTNDDVGNSIRAGIEAEASFSSKTADFVYEQVSVATPATFTTAVAKLKAQEVKAVILAMNQAPFAPAVTALAENQLNVPVFTSYVNADITAVDAAQYSADRDIYTNAWVDVFTTEGQAAVAEFVATVNQADLDQATKTAYYTNSFAIAGYIAAKVFVEGLQRVETNGDDLTVENYVAAMEEGPIDIPMGGTVDFSEGKRWGIDSMSLLKYTYGDNPATADVVETEFEGFVKVREIETLTEIQAK